jgi:K+-transporting ATPase ATPase C chain
MKKIWKTSLRMLGALMLLTGLIYPLAVTLACNTAFKRQAQGSLVYAADGSVAGSSLLAQEFKSPRYFWPRPSAGNFETLPSGASNLSPAGAALKQALDKRAAFLRAAHGLDASAPIPSDLLYASGSGLDPHISLQAALFQVSRVALARGLDRAKVEDLVNKSARKPAPWLFGNTVVDVLALNLSLDGVY